MQNNNRTLDAQLSLIVERAVLDSSLDDEHLSPLFLRTFTSIELMSDVSTIAVDTRSENVPTVLLAFGRSFVREGP